MKKLQYLNEPGEGRSRRFRAEYKPEGEKEAIYLLVFAKDLPDALAKLADEALSGTVLTVKPDGYFL